MKTFHGWLHHLTRVIDSEAIVEVKCPYTAKDKHIDQVTVPYLQKCASGLTLDKNHVYFYQVQGQLLCSTRKVCYFCVFILKDFKVCKITRDEEFITDMVTKLNTFYDSYFRPALLQKHVYKFYDQYF